MVGSFQSFRISFQFQLMEPNYLVRPQTDTAGSKLFHLLVIQLVDEMFRNLS